MIRVLKLIENPECSWPGGRGVNDTIKRLRAETAALGRQRHAMRRKSLKDAGLKITQPRLSILRVLQNHRDGHLTADDIYRCLVEAGEDQLKLSATNLDISIATTTDKAHRALSSASWRL